MAANRLRDVVSLATAYDDATTDDTIEFHMPEDLAVLDDAALAEALDTARAAFDALDSDEVTPDIVETMTQLADAAEALRDEQARREAEAAEARAKADELRQRISGSPEDDESDAEPEAAADDEAPIAEVTDEAIAEVIEQETAVVASSDEQPKRQPLSITLSGARSRRAPEPVVEAPKGLSLVAAADLPGIASGSTITPNQAAEAFIAKSRGINVDAMRRSAASGKRSVQSFQLGSVIKEFPEELRVTRGSDADAILKLAADSSRLPGGSLVASGAGWCSPSEVLYELAEAAETTDGMFSLPEVQVDRGGLRHTLGADFSSVFSEDAISWSFTEDEVEAGDYDGYGGGSKPCFFVECADFVEDRLDVAGVCIRAGLLTNNAYPELIENIVRKSLVAHEFKQARRKLARIAAGSTAVTMPGNPSGATSPTLDAIELQVEDYKQRHRIGRGRSLEAIFPHWVRGAIRADLARRAGVMLTNVSDADIVAHLATRGVNAQFVYELDDLTGPAADRTAFPDQFKFLLYLEGTWIGGTTAVINLESVFDSALVEQNIYTQLFTEEGWLVAKRFHDSRVVTVPICVDGMTRFGFEAVTTDCDGTVVKDSNEG